MQFQDEIARENLTEHAHFTKVDCGEFSVSAQGGEYPYSSPRKWHVSAHMYIEMEVAVFWRGAWAIPVGWESYFEPIGKHTTNSVAAYMPAEAIQRMINNLRSGQLRCRTVAELASGLHPLAWEAKTVDEECDNEDLA